MRDLISGRQSRMCSIRIWFSDRARLVVPHFVIIVRYLGCAEKNDASFVSPCQQRVSQIE